MQLAKIKIVKKMKDIYIYIYIYIYLKYIFKHTMHCAAARHLNAAQTRTNRVFFDNYFVLIKV